MKCKNCGAELNNGKCEYCGSVFLEDMRYVIPNIDLRDVDIDLILRKAPIYKGNPYRDLVYIRGMHV